MSRTDYHYNTVKHILKTIQYATLATVSKDGEPWNSPVWAMHDSQLCFYWFSDKASQHAKNVRSSGKVFIVIYDSRLSQSLPTGNRNGLYLQTRAYELQDIDEIRRVRLLKKDKDDTADFIGRSVRRAYKAVPVRAWINDVQIEKGKFIRDYRVELSLPELRRRLSSA
jgi:hypothetical protein